MFLDLDRGETFEDRRSGLDRRKILRVGVDRRAFEKPERRIPTKEEVLAEIRRTGVFSY
jgi:hypothetical protein